MEDPITKGALRKILTRVVPSFKKRPDPEREQAVIRLLIGVVAGIYLLSVMDTDSGNFQVISVTGMIAFFILAFAILLSIIKSPGVNVPRRLFGCIVDNGTATAFLLLNGDLVAPIFIVYLWVSFGNGFRFGKQYLLFSMVLGIIGFSSVLLFSSRWSAEFSVNIGLLVGLVALPLYVASLLSRLERALVSAQEANRAKSNFLATMSHEIRTPLNGLIGMLDLLDMTNLETKQQYYVNLMKNSSDWLLNVISDGLDFTKIEADELVIESVPMDVKSIIFNICEVYREVAHKKAIALKEDVTDLTIFTVACDPNRLTQVLNNLLNNGCKFTETGEVRLKVTSEGLSNEMVRLSFRVSDTGVGIAAENLDSIFSPFKQVRTEGSNHFSGTGLGLAISSRLIKLMGGRIDVESTPGVGTTFSFFVDVPVVRERQIQKQVTPPKGIIWQSQPQVLLVEDNQINQEVAIAYLQQLGCKVSTADDGLEALDLVQQKRFDLIFMDCQMPKMDGYETTRRIRSREGTYMENIIIALTAHITKRDKEKCFEAGMNDYMGKPYKIETLQHFLIKWLKSPPIAEDIHASAERVDSTEEVLERSSKPENRKKLHDLRNALGGVIGGVELAMISKDDPDNCERHLKTALKGAQQAISISSELS